MQSDSRELQYVSECRELIALDEQRDVLSASDDHVCACNKNVTTSQIFDENKLHHMESHEVRTAQRFLDGDDRDEGSEEAIVKKEHCAYQLVCSFETNRKEIPKRAGGTAEQQSQAELLNDEQENADAVQLDRTAQWSNAEREFEFAACKQSEQGTQLSIDGNSTEALQGLVAIATEKDRTQREESSLLRYDLASDGKRRLPIEQADRNTQSPVDTFLISGCKTSNYTVLMDREDQIDSENCRNIPPHPNFISCLDFSVKLSRSSYAWREVDSEAKEGKVCEKSLCDEWKPSINVVTPVCSEDLSRFVYRPCSIVLSAGPCELTEMDDCRRPGNVTRPLQHLVNKHHSGADDMECGDGLRSLSYDACKGGSDGRSLKFPLKKGPGSPSDPSTSVIRNDETIRDVASQLLTPLLTSCVESSECGNFNTDIIADNVKIEGNSVSNANGRSCYSVEEADANFKPSYQSDEVHAMSGAGELERLEVGLGVEEGTVKASRQARNVGYGALDLLVSAIQMTSGSIGEDDKFLGCAYEEKDGRQDWPDSQLWSVEAQVVYGSSPIVKKRVLRRAKSAFKKPADDESMKEVLKLKVAVSVADPPSHRRGRERKRQASEQQHLAEEEWNNVRLPYLDRGFIRDGEPVIRSKRGRSQALPTKFYDSVLQPWKRKSRRKQKAQLEMP